MVDETFYPFVENGEQVGGAAGDELVVRHSARIAVFDDPAAAPRVVIVEPADIRSYLEQITQTVTRLAQEQGGRIPFTVIREVVENLIHAYFLEPTVSILDGGNTIRFSDQGPGIVDKQRALEFGTTSATAAMKRYIRGVGSGLPYAQQWLEEKGGSLTVEDNIHQGTVVTISLVQGRGRQPEGQGHHDAYPQVPYQPQQSYEQTPAAPAGWPQQGMAAAPAYPQPTAPGGWPAGYGYAPGGQAPWPYPTPYPTQGYAPSGYPAQGYPAQGYPPQPGAYPMTQTAAAPAAPTISDRGRAVLDYLRTHESVGPRDLNALFPLSESTWSRELSQLEGQGFISKQGGQKRRLTDLGRQMLAMGF